MHLQYAYKYPHASIPAECIAPLVALDRFASSDVCLGGVVMT